MSGHPDRSTGRIVVAGAGFAGVYATLYLSRAEFPEDTEILLVDPKNFFTFTPLLAEVVAGTLGREHVTYPLRVLGRRHGFRFQQAAATGVDPVRRRLLTDRGEIAFDYLIIAVGSGPAYFGVPGASEHGEPLVSVEDALAIRGRVIATMEAALACDSGLERRRLLTFVVAGAGPAGVEVASEILHLVRSRLPPYYPELPEPRVILAQAADRILRGWDAELACAGQERLRDCGIELHLNTRIERVEPDRVAASGPEGSMEWPLGTLIWTTGTEPPDWIGETDLPTERRALEVTPVLQVEGQDRIFAAGDVTVLTDERTGRPYPRVAPIAISQGIRAAANVENHALGRALEPYHAYHAGSIVSLGSGMALVDILGFRARGRVAWWIYRAAYLLKLVGLKNKIRVLVTLALNRLFEPDIATDLRLVQSEDGC